MVRHGQSTWNAEGRWQGQADPPLTAVGESQALQAAAALEEYAPWSAIVTSDLQRAAVTASIIADELGHPRVALDKRLRERHVGDWQGLTRTEVEARYPGLLESGRRPDNFESTHAAGRRGLEALIAVAAHLDGGGPALVVSHGGIVRAIRHLVGLDEELGFPNLSGQWFDVDGSAVVPGEVVLLAGHEQPAPSAAL